MKVVFWLVNNGNTMPRNVEIKARVGDMSGLIEKASSLAKDDGTLIEQEDTFFNVAHGRLKLRTSAVNSAAQPAVLIHYDRPDQQGPKLSSYDMVQVDDADKMKSVLTAAVGVKGTVKKSRHLILLDQTRIHIDDVEGLGHFMELEVVLRDDQSEQDGQLIAQNIMDSLEVKKDDLLDCAYMDMIMQL
ncbi:hypothetical protein Btru_012574 [Bulinus truncatus]|nr:hypothetical protein Btru_012574 [Bulinus truncatus]